MRDLGISQNDFLQACKEAASQKRQWRIIKQILLVDDFQEFKKIMVKRNQELERQALSLMLQQEHRQVQSHLAPGQAVAHI